MTNLSHWSAADHSSESCVLRCRGIPGIPEGRSFMQANLTENKKGVPESARLSPAMTPAHHDCDWALNCPEGNDVIFQ